MLDAISDHPEQGADKFERLGDLADLEMAEKYYAQALELNPHENPERAHILSGLAGTLKQKFRRLGDLSDLNQGMNEDVDDDCEHNIST